MTPWEASLKGVVAQAIDSQSLHINELLPTLISEVNHYIQMSEHLKSKFSKLKTSSDYFDRKMMLVQVSVPAWTVAEYLWAFNKVTAQLKNALFHCFGTGGNKQFFFRIHDSYQRKDADRSYLIGSLGYQSLEKIISVHLELHEPFGKLLLDYTTAVKYEYLEIEKIDSDLLRLGISLISIDLTYLWRQSFYILKQVSLY